MGDRVKVGIYIWKKLESPGSPTSYQKVKILDIRFFYFLRCSLIALSSPLFGEYFPATGSSKSDAVTFR